MYRLLLLIFCALPVCAQPSGFLPLDEFVQDWKISKQFTIAVAQQMPAEFYDFKATPEEMTFGEQMVHIAASLLSRFHEISGEKLPYSDAPKKINKEVALEWLNQSFDYVIRVLPKLTEEQLSKKEFTVDWVGRSAVSGRVMARNMFVHVAHHRAQCEVYLRLKGITPPEYTF